MKTYYEVLSMDYRDNIVVFSPIAVFSKEDEALDWINESGSKVKTYTIVKTFSIINTN